MNGISHHSAKWNEVLRAYYAIRAHSRDLEKQESKSQGKIIFSLLFLVYSTDNKDSPKYS